MRLEDAIGKVCILDEARTLAGSGNIECFARVRGEGEVFHFIVELEANKQGVRDLLASKHPHAFVIVEEYGQLLFCRFKA